MSVYESAGGDEELSVGDATRLRDAAMARMNLEFRWGKMQEAHRLGQPFDTEDLGDFWLRFIEDAPAGEDPNLTFSEMPWAKVTYEETARSAQFLRSTRAEFRRRLVAVANTIPPGAEVVTELAASYHQALERMAGETAGDVLETLDELQCRLQAALAPLAKELLRHGYRPSDFIHALQPSSFPRTKP